MAWTNEDGEHDGWDAAEFPGSRFSVGSRAGGATVRRFPPGPGRLARATGEPEEVDGREAIGWRALCECGWRGQLWKRVATPAEHDPADHQIHDPDPSPYGDAPAEVADAMHAEWLAHLDPPTLTAVRIEARALNAAQARLTEAVRAARDDGRSWADIGGAVGISRQSAHERWARITVPAQSCGEPYPAGPGRRCIRPDGHDGDHQTATGIDWPAGVARTRAVPWGTVTDEKGRRAWTAGQLRAALAGLDDDAPVIVHVATDEDGVVDDQIITSAGHGMIGWGDGDDLEPDPLFALECHWHTAGDLHIWPRR